MSGSPPTPPTSPTPPAAVRDGGPIPRRTAVAAALDAIERLGNRLPDPAVLFLLALVVVGAASAWLSSYQFAEINPRTGEAIEVVNLLTGDSLAQFLANMVKIFTGFAPLGVVLVAMLGVGAADASGLINVGLKELLRFTPAQLLTPMLLLVAIVSHTAADAGYMLVIPIGGLMFRAAGRHPLAGIACAFAGVSGGFSANFIPSGIDPLLAAFTQAGAGLVDGEYQVNPLCNLYFTAVSSLLVIAAGWYVTDRIVEPRLAGAPDDAIDAAPAPLADVTRRDRWGLAAALGTLLAGAGLLFAWAWPADSPLRANGSLTSLNPEAPLMGAIVPLIFLFFLTSGIVHGYVSGTFKNHRDVVAGMKRAMESMAYYLVLVFFASLFIYAFNQSNLGILIALKGAAALKAWGASQGATLVGLVLLATTINLFVGSASAKWAMLAPIFVPMLMLGGIAPELTQAAYRVGDSATNIVTPMMPYFPLVVVYSQSYVRRAGVGTVGAMMLPYSVAFLMSWTALLLLYWQVGLPLGLGARYAYP